MIGIEFSVLDGSIVKLSDDDPDGDGLGGMRHF